MEQRLLTIAALLVCITVVTLSAACGGDSSSPEPTPAPTTSGATDLSPQVGGVATARRYLQDTGISGKKGDFTDPRSCAEITKDSKGDFCVHENFSTYATGLVILRVANRDKPTEDVWEMRLKLQDKQWVVTDVKPFGGPD